MIFVIYKNNNCSCRRKVFVKGFNQNYLTKSTVNPVHCNLTMNCMSSSTLVQHYKFDQDI